MYLRELSISGFKSFAAPTRLELQPGVTAIVGPNGCGKSNIADAIRWVLGEQSAKALRGGKMQDVIFSGSDSRKALPYAEVYLTFSGCEKELGSAFHEVEIGRRVSRDGSGVYTINRKVCRLKDIQSLFMDTGVGRVSYSFLVQGQVDQILSSNPADRRAVFEEAAGITRYKSQRREALNKLDLVQANLNRVTDVIEERGRQIGTLRRQASKALRYKRIKHRLSHLELAQGGFEYATLTASTSSLSERASRHQQELQQIRSTIEERESALEALRQQRNRSLEELQAQQQKVFDCRSELEQTTNQIAFDQQRSQDLAERIEQLSSETNELVQRQALAASQGNEESRSRQMQLDLVGTSDASCRELQSSLDSAEMKLSEAEKALQREKQRFLVVESGISRLRTRATTIEVDLKSAEARHGDFVDAIRLIGAEIETARQSLQELQTARSVIEEREQQAALALTAAEEQVSQEKKTFRARQESIQVSEREIAKLTAELALLEDLQRKFEGFGDGAKAILSGKLGSLLPASGTTIFTRQIEVQEAHATAFEHLIGEAVDALLLPPTVPIAQVAEKLRGEKLGQACCLLPQKSPPDPSSLPDLPPWLIPAASVAQARDPLIAPLLQNLLEGSYLIPALEPFLDFLDSNPDFSFRIASTPEGDRIDSRGTVLIGKRKSRSGSFLQRENQIRSLRSSVAQKREALDQAYAAASQAQEALSAAEKALEQARAARSEAASERSALLAQITSAERSLESLGTRGQHAREQLDRFETEQADARQRLSSARQQLGSAEEELSESRTATSNLEAELVRARAERDSHREALSSVRLELAEKKQKLEILNRSINEATRQAEELGTRIQSNRKRIDSMRQEISGAGEKARALATRSEELKANLEGLTAHLSSLQAKVQQSDGIIDAASTKLASTRQQEREAEQQVSSLEIELTKLRSRRDFIVEKLTHEYEVEAGNIRWKEELWAADEPFQTRVNLDDLEDSETLELQTKGERGDPTPEDFARMEETDWTALSREIKSLREKLASIGAVNLVAIEEYAELRQSYEFLKTQSEDLWHSKEELLRAIDEINQTSQSLFQQTFDQIRKNFQFTYEHLTIGGRGDLELNAAEDVLESGIEIIARPPGTRLSTISLLSGGQRTMAAVALLFAIYMVKPSPFCFLDELDAPLDDANIGRFTEMLRDFTRFSQFLIITHNKRTVASADSVFGVTMQEKGVSRLVSMRFNRDSGSAEFAREEQGSQPASLTPAAPV